MVDCIFVGIMRIQVTYNQLCQWTIIQTTVNVIQYTKVDWKVSLKLFDVICVCLVNVHIIVQHRKSVFFGHPV